MSTAELTHIAPRELKPPPFNTRTTFDDDKMANLVESIKSGGVHEPIIARRVNGHIEIVAGERRWRAAKEAKVQTVPVILRELSDAEALEVQLTENEQREDVSALDQAAGFRRLMDLDPKTYTAETLAQRIGLKPASVYLRLKLLAMIDPAKEMFRSGFIDAGHAVLIARLSTNDQERAVKMLEPYRKQGNPVSVRDLKNWIQQNVRVDLFGPELAETQPAVAGRLVKLKEKGVEVAQITRKYLDPAEAKKLNLLTWNDYREVGKKKCDHARVGAIVLGSGNEKVELLDVCTDKSCKTHWPELVARKKELKAAKRQSGESAAAKAKRVAAEAAAKRKREVENLLRGHVVTHILTTTKAVSKTVLAILVARELNNSGALEYGDELKAAGLDKLERSCFGKDGGAALAKASDRQLAQLAAFAVAQEQLEFDLPAVAKLFGVDLKKLEKQHLQTTAKAAADVKDGGKIVRHSKGGKKR